MKIVKSLLKWIGISAVVLMIMSNLALLTVYVYETHKYRVMDSMWIHTQVKTYKHQHQHLEKLEFLLTNKVDNVEQSK